VIDLTEDTSDGDDLEIESPKFYGDLIEKKGRSKQVANGVPNGRQAGRELDDESEAGPSNSGSVKGKEREKTSSITEEPESTVFTPMTRSIMSGWKLSLSPSPPPAKRARTDSPAAAEIFIDEKPAPIVPSGPDGGEHFDPPGLFSTSLIPSKKTKRTLRKEEQKQAGVGAKEDSNTVVEEGDQPLLLPEHITLESAGERAEAEEEPDRSMEDEEGLHVLDDSKAKVSLASEQFV
jgi:hypothetical protein